MRALLKRRWFWLGAVVLAAIALATLFVVQATRDSPERRFLEVANALERDGFTTEPRLWHAKNGICVVKVGPPPQSWPFTQYLALEVVPDSRPFWERIQDEYRYQKRKRGW
jgi:hypothetical protein